MIYTPQVVILPDNNVEIIGDAEALESLGHALLLKAKMGRNFKFSMCDTARNPSITLLLNEEVWN